jgi:predicted MPP superfamily phosphohydrolase
MELSESSVEWSEAIALNRREIPLRMMMLAYGGIVVSLLLWCLLSVMTHFWGQWLFFAFPIVLCLGAALLIAGSQTAYLLQVRRFPVSLVPAGEKPSHQLRIALVSDLHLGRLKGREWLFQLVEAINRQSADLVLIAGDFVYKAQQEKLGYTLWPLKDLVSRRGTFAVLGNHDYGLPHGDNCAEDLGHLLPQFGVDVLRNESVRLDEGLYLLGLDDLWAGRSDWAKACAHVPQEGQWIVCAHNPDVVVDRSPAGPLCETGLPPAGNRQPLWLCGHTHGGQVLPLWLRNFSHLFDRGWYQTQAGKVFVTQGAGEVGASLRWTSQPEVAILDVTL